MPEFLAKERDVLVKGEDERSGSLLSSGVAHSKVPRMLGWEPRMKTWCSEGIGAPQNPLPARERGLAELGPGARVPPEMAPIPRTVGGPRGARNRVATLTGLSRRPLRGSWTKPRAAERAGEEGLRAQCSLEPRRAYTIPACERWAERSVTRRSVASSVCTAGHLCPLPPVPGRAARIRPISSDSKPGAQEVHPLSRQLKKGRRERAGRRA